MNLEGKIIGNRYQIIEKIGNRRNGNCIQGKVLSFK